MHAWSVVAALALSVVGPGALVAAGDDGPSRSLPTDRPTRTSLRPTELSDAPTPRASNKEVVVLVSGINSSAPDPTFDVLIARLLADPRYEVHRFGADPTHPYDALGSIAENARNLTEEVRELGKTHPAVHIVAHSMGGVVVDHAVAGGLSAQDGVATYVALASPHNGSLTLAATAPVVELIGDPSLEVRALFSVKLDVGSDAAKDLAHASIVPPPAGVTRLDLRMSSDWTVTSRDAADPGVESRVLLPTTVDGYIDGHGAITRDDRSLDLITTTLATRAVPPDTRSADIRAAADRQSGAAFGISLLICVVGLLVTCGVAVALTRFAPIRSLTRGPAEARLRDVRRK